MAVFSVLNGTGLDGDGIQFGSTFSAISASNVGGFFIRPTDGAFFYHDGGTLDFEGTGMNYGTSFSGTLTSLTYTTPADEPLFSITGLDVPLGEIASVVGTDVVTDFGPAVLGTMFSGDDTISGSTMDDALMGFNGDDALHGGTGADVLAGGAGGDTLDGGAGIDTADYGTSASRVTINLLAQTAGDGDAAGDILTSIENLIGSAFNDSLIGDDGANVLIGGGGNDALNGGWGSDALDGGAGIDWAYYTDAAGVQVNLAAGTGHGEQAEGDTLSGIENIWASEFNDQLTGDAGDNVLWGGGGADVLDGGAGTDWAYYTLSAAVQVNLATGTGTGGEAQGDTLTGIENLRGSGFGDILTGDGGANALIGGDGNDMLYGGAGVDAIDGGNGIDAAGYFASGAAVTVDLAAGTGIGGDAQGDVLSNIENLGGSKFNDTLSGNAGANQINGGGGDDTVAGAGGNDTLYGGNGTDQLKGGDGWDTLQGEAGDDQLTGGAGGDILRGGDGADHLAGGADDDVASYWSSAVGVVINLQTGVNTGGEAQGDTIATDIEIIHGSNHDDVMTGNALGNALIGFDGADTLSGGGGGDVLRGGGGADTLTGGSGAEYFSYTAVSDSTASAADTIQDFQPGNDLLSLRMIDADGKSANGDTAFSFIGTAGFSGAAGELRYEIAGGTTTVSADVNGDSAADIVIHLNGAIALQASDFLL